MNAKYALALILTLQVTMSLCDDPVPVATPSPELLKKYNDMKSTFYKRLLNAYGKVQEAVIPLVETSTAGQNIKNMLLELKDNTKVQAAAEIGAGLGAEAGSSVDDYRLSGLAAYEKYLRPYIGTLLDSGINDMKFFLDIFLPAE